MARNSLNYTVTDEGRDAGKVFVITELPASRAESWAMRAILALMQGGAQIPDGFERKGMAGLAELGLNALMGLRWEDLEPLLDEMFTCIQMMPDPTKPHVIRALIESDIEELMTRIKLRAEVWKLHTGFLKAVAPLISAPSRAPASRKRTRNTKTSRQ
jgi:hypothetical protein